MPTAPRTSPYMQAYAMPITRHGRIRGGGRGSRLSTPKKAVGCTFYDASAGVRQGGIYSSQLQHTRSVIVVRSNRETRSKSLIQLFLSAILGHCRLSGPRMFFHKYIFTTIDFWELTLHSLSIWIEGLLSKTLQHWRDKYFSIKVRINSIPKE